MQHPMKILLVEDSATDRELLRYLLEEKFANEIRFTEASNFANALRVLQQGDTDCVLLDLQLPDSSGKGTFLRLYSRYPHIPIIVMTHNKDRSLAIDMIQAGAADYMLKDFDNAEEMFRRILFAIKKHQTTIRCTPDQAGAVRQLEQAQAAMVRARKSKSVPNMQAANSKATEAISAISRKMFEEMAQLSAQLAKQAAKQEHITDIVDQLDKELLRGHSGRPSMRSQMDLIEHRVAETEVDIRDIKKEVDEVEDTQQRNAAAAQVTTANITSRTKVLLAILGLIGTIAAATIGYYEKMHKPSTPVEKPGK